MQVGYCISTNVILVKFWYIINKYYIYSALQSLINTFSFNFEFV